MDQRVKTEFSPQILWCFSIYTATKKVHIWDPNLIQKMKGIFASLQQQKKCSLSYRGTLPRLWCIRNWVRRRPWRKEMDSDESNSSSNWASNIGWKLPSSFNPLSLSRVRPQTSYWVNLFFLCVSHFFRRHNSKASIGLVFCCCCCWVYHIDSVLLRFAFNLWNNQRPSSK